MPDSGFEEAQRRIQKALDTGATTLDLGGLELVAIPEAIANLTELTELYLSSNQLTSLPDAIGKLTNLTTIDLGINQLTSVPDSLGKLTNLKTLGLDSNQLKILPDMIGNLANLSELYLSSNQLTNVPDAIANLTNLTVLSLYSTQLTSVPDAIGKLTNLTVLYLGSNQLTSLPDAIVNLTNLTELALESNQLTSLPETIANLPDLSRLYLSSNQLTSLPDSIGKLTNLMVLNLSSNQLTSLPETIANLTNLIVLNLSSNQLMSLPDAIANLKKLRSLDLRDNNLSELSQALKELSNLDTLKLHGNEALSIPPEVLENEWQPYKGGKKDRIQQILNYYFRSRQGERRPLNEAKLILVGYGSVGKTSIVNGLLNKPFDKNSPETDGIQITPWDITVKQTEKVRLNIWDFGGQEIMHATHQFFLTERSIYLLVLNGRQGHEDSDADYWLNLIQSFGKDSPVIVILNKINSCHFDLNRGGLRQKFKNIVEFIETDCENHHHLPELLQLIQEQVDSLKHLRNLFPAEWFQIKDHLGRMSENYVSYERYRAICTELGESDAQAQDDLARILHYLGTILNYNDDPRLRSTNVLNPHWVTRGIYTLLTSKAIAKNQGEFHCQDIQQHLDSKEYPIERHSFLIDLMQKEKFELCLPFSDRPGIYLIPQLLGKQQPDEAIQNFDPHTCLNFQYHYPTLPEGLLPRFIVRTQSLSTQHPRWRTGVILAFDGAQALVKTDIPEKRIYISVTGDIHQQRLLLAIIRKEFAHIHQNFSFTPEAMVPVPGYPETLISYQELIAREQQGRRMIECMLPNGKFLDLKVADLLNGVGYEQSQNTDQSSAPENGNYYDLRGASIGNFAENQHGIQQNSPPS